MNVKELNHLVAAALIGPSAAILIYRGSPATIGFSIILALALGYLLPMLLRMTKLCSHFLPLAAMGALFLQT